MNETADHLLAVLSIAEPLFTLQFIMADYVEHLKHHLLVNLQMFTMPSVNNNASKRFYSACKEVMPFNIQ